jgi:hypothetical protein
VREKEENGGSVSLLLTRVRIGLCLVGWEQELSPQMFSMTIGGAQGFFYGEPVLIQSAATKRRADGRLSSCVVIMGTRPALVYPEHWRIL